MIATRYDEYKNRYSTLPFILYPDLERSRFKRSGEQNWHEDIELQLCTKGEGVLLLDGVSHPFKKGDIGAINSNVIHYTGTDTFLSYTCLIIKADFCRQIGIDCTAISFEEFVKSNSLAKKIEALVRAYTDKSDALRTARLNKLLLDILIELTEKHSSKKRAVSYSGKALEEVKGTIKYIRENYGQKISLDDIAKAVCTDKYALCRSFKRLTGQTIFENLNNYRCVKALELLKSGSTVTQAAEGCGFENLSFFSKTFKKYMGILPGEAKKLN